MPNLQIRPVIGEPELLLRRLIWALALERPKLLRPRRPGVAPERPSEEADSE